MASCENILGCPFFTGKVKLKDGLSKIDIIEFCLGNQTRCARYRVLNKLGRAAVPDDLLPSEADRAEELIAASDNLTCIGGN